MRGRNLFLGVFGVCALLGSALASAQSTVRFSEIHYDNAGTDAGEAIEISGPAGADVTGWQVVALQRQQRRGLRHQDAERRDPRDLRRARCAGRQLSGERNPERHARTAWRWSMPAAAVDRVPLVRGHVRGGRRAGDGLTSSTSACSRTAPGRSASRCSATRDGTWNGPATATFGACNDNGDTHAAAGGRERHGGAGRAPRSMSAARRRSPPPHSTPRASRSPASRSPGVVRRPAIATVTASGVVTGVAAGDATITATAPNGVAGSATLHVNGRHDAAGVRGHVQRDPLRQRRHDAGEAIEIEGPAGHRSDRLDLVLYDGNGGAPLQHARPLSGHDPRDAAATRGVVVVNYPSNGLQNGSPDGIALVDARRRRRRVPVVRRHVTAIDGSGGGMTSIDIGAAGDVVVAARPVAAARFGQCTGRWPTSTFGACNARRAASAGEHDHLQRARRRSIRRCRSASRTSCSRRLARRQQHDRSRRRSSGRRRRRRSRASTRTA